MDLLEIFNKMKARKAEIDAEEKREYTVKSEDGKVVFYCTGSTLNKVSFNGEPEKIVIPDGIAIIEDHCFEECKFIKEVVFSKVLDKIGDSAFANCTGLEKAVFPEGLRIIGLDAFMYCPLKEIRIPESVRTVFGGAFDVCNKAEIITFSPYTRLLPGCFDYTKGEIFVSYSNGLFPLNISWTDEIRTKYIVKAVDLLNGKEEQTNEYVYISSEEIEMLLRFYCFAEKEITEKYIIENFNKFFWDSIITPSNCVHFNRVLEKLYAKGLVTAEMSDEMFKELIRKFSKEETLDPDCMQLLNIIIRHSGLNIMKLCEDELVYSIRQLCPVPWKRIHFTAAFNGQEFVFDYCIEEEYTGFVSCRENEQSRYGWIMIYKRRSRLYDELETICRNLLNVHNICDKQHPSNNTEFTVENNGDYSANYAIFDPAAFNGWKNKYITGEMTGEYPAEKLPEYEESVSKYEAPKADSENYIKRALDYIKQCSETDADCFIDILPPLCDERIQQFVDGYRKNGAEPDKEYIEFLKYCDGVSVNNNCIHGIGNGQKYIFRDIPDGYEQIAEDIIFGYALSCMTGKCYQFDEGEGSEYSFARILESCVDECDEAFDDLKKKLEQEELIRNGYLLSDSTAAFYRNHFGEDKLKLNAQRAEQEKFKEERFLYSSAFYKLLSKGLLNP